MKKFSITLAFLTLALSSSIMAQPKNTTAGDKDRAKAQCDANQSVCTSVAGDDYNSCTKTPNTNCLANYNEDIDSCNADHASCINAVGLKGASASIVIGSGSIKASSK